MDRVWTPTYHDIRGPGEYRDVAYNDDENGEGEAGDEFEGGADQSRGDDEAQEQEPDKEAPNEKQDYVGGEQVEDDGINKVKMSRL